MYSTKRKTLYALLLGLASCFSVGSMAQTIPLDNLNAFKSPPPANWKIVGNASADISKENALTTTPGTGVLACIHEKGKYGAQYELISNFTHGDLDIELDFMMSKGSNSGIYLQGNYEVQLFDSWVKNLPSIMTAVEFTNAGTTQSQKAKKDMMDMLRVTT